MESIHLINPDSTEFFHPSVDDCSVKMFISYEAVYKCAVFHFSKLLDFDENRSKWIASGLVTVYKTTLKVGIPSLVGGLVLYSMFYLKPYLFITLESPVIAQ